jgi:hypothetical protein
MAPTEPRVGDPRRRDRLTQFCAPRGVVAMSVIPHFANYVAAFEQPYASDD